MIKRYINPRYFLTLTLDSNSSLSSVDGSATVTLPVCGVDVVNNNSASALQPSTVVDKVEV